MYIRAYVRSLVPVDVLPPPLPYRFHAFGFRNARPAGVLFMFNIPHHINSFIST